MSIQVLSIVFFLAMIALLATGIPIAFAMGAVSLLFAWAIMGPQSLGIVANSTVSIVMNFTLLTIPLFVFMANVLERSGVVDDLYTMMQHWMGPLRGGLAMGTVIICTIFAAMSAVSAAGTVTMSVVALPSMLRRGYDKYLSMGCIAAGGALGQLIPPSGMLIVYALLTGESVGRLFLGGIIPGIILAGLFILYIGIRCYFQPHLGPVIPKAERVGWGPKLVSLRSVILPILLVVAVLGSMFAGVTTPTESAAVGAFGSILCALAYRRFGWSNLTQSLYGTIRLTCMIVWMMVGGLTFSAVYSAIGAQHFIVQMMQGLGMNPWMIIILIQIIWIILGCLMDGNGILFLTVPIFLPIIKTLGFNPVWFGVLWMVNMEMGFLTPPFGMNLFYMKAVAPKDITMGDIYKSVVPYVGMQLIGLVICMVFPQTILWLPKQVMG